MSQDPSKEHLSGHEEKIYMPYPSNLIRFKNGSRLHSVTLSIGDDISVFVYGRCKPNCRFIKVTRKGFNILNLDTDRCILRHHLYAKGMGNKEFSAKGPITGEFLISEYMAIQIKEKKEGKIA